MGRIILYSADSGNVRVRQKGWRGGEKERGHVLLKAAYDEQLGCTLFTAALGH